MEMKSPLFKDRHEAGRKLADKLSTYPRPQNLVILALSAGGLAVAYEVAKALNAPLDLFLMRNLAVPGREDLSMGVVTSGGATVFHQNITRPLDIHYSVIDEAVARERAALEQDLQRYHVGSQPYDLEDKNVVLVDDGLTTGMMMADAVTGMRDLGALRVVIAVPTAMPETYTAYDDVDSDDSIVCVEMPHAYRGMDTWYGDNSQVSDDEVRTMLAQAPKMGG